MNQSSVIRTFSLLLISAVGAGCGGDPYIEAQDETVPAYPTTGVCSSLTDNVWAVGTELDVALVGQNGGIRFSINGRLPLPNWSREFAPINARVESSDPSVWQISSGPDSSNIVHIRAIGAGSAQLTMTADGTNPSTITLRALTSLPCNSLSMAHLQRIT